MDGLVLFFEWCMSCFDVWACVFFVILGLIANVLFLELKVFM